MTDYYRDLPQSRLFALRGEGAVTQRKRGVTRLLLRDEDETDKSPV